MLKSYKNALFYTIIKEGFDINKFRMIERITTLKRKISTIDAYKEYDASVVIFEDSGLYFAVMLPGEKDKHSFYCKFNLMSLNYQEVEQGRYTFDDILSDFKIWLNNEVSLYISEQNMPDLWSQLEGYKDIIRLDIISTEDTKSFTETEKMQLRVVVQEFRTLVVNNFGPSTDQLSQIDSRLNYLTDSVDRLNQFDWKSLIIGTMISIILTLALDHAQGELLYSLLQQAFRSVFNSLP